MVASTSPPGKGLGYPKAMAAFVVSDTPAALARRWGMCETSLRSWARRVRAGCKLDLAYMLAISWDKWIEAGFEPNDLPPRSSGISKTRQSVAGYVESPESIREKALRTRIYCKQAQRDRRITFIPRNISVHDLWHNLDWGRRNRLDNLMAFLEGAAA